MKRGLGVGLLLIFTVLLMAANGMQIEAEGGGYYIPIRWSADGSQLLVDTDCTAGPDDLPGIYLLDVENGQISGGTQIANRDYYMSYLPPTPLITEHAILSREDDIYLVNIEDGSLRNITGNIAPVGYYVWPPVGEILIIATEDRDLYALDATNGETHILTADIPAITGSFRSVNNELLIVEADDNDLYVLDVASGEAHNLTVNIPDVSYMLRAPNNDMLVFVTDSDDLYTLDIASGEANVFRGNFSRIDYQSWSPNGERFIFRPDDRELYALDIASRIVRRLTDEIHASMLSYTLVNDETLIVTTSDHELYVLNIVSSDVQLLTENIPSIRFSHILPEGTIVLVITEDNGIYTLDIATGEVRRLVANLAMPIGWTSLSPDSSMLVVGTTYKNDMYAVDLATGEVRFLVPGVVRFDMPYGLWSPDGNFYVAQSHNHLFVMSRDGEAIYSINGSVSPYVASWSSQTILIVKQDNTSNASQPGWYSVGPYSVYVLPRDIGSGRSTSPDNRLIAFEDCTAEYGVHLVNLDNAPVQGG